MKRQLIYAVLGLGVLPLAADEADEYYRRGTAAMARGDAASAQAAFTEALRLKPSHANARYQLGNLKLQKGDMVSKSRASRLAGVKLTKVEFSDVTLTEALQALNLMVENETGGADSTDAFSPNFMIQDPKGELGKTEVTIRLKNVPAKTALDYLLEQASATARYDEHATVIRPAGK